MPPQKGVSSNDVEQAIVKEIRARVSCYTVLQLPLSYLLSILFYLQCPTTAKMQSNHGDDLDVHMEDSNIEMMDLPCASLIPKLTNLVHIYARIKHHLFQMHSSAHTSRSRWKELFSQQRKKCNHWVSQSCAFLQTQKVAVTISTLLLFKMMCLLSFSQDFLAVSIL